jgi:hypothetical protein
MRLFRGDEFLTGWLAENHIAETSINKWSVIMPVTTEITSYSVIYSSNRFRPRIELMNGNEYIGQLVFFPDRAPLPVDSQWSDGSVDLHYHIVDFHNVIDLLRNEKPVFLNFNGSGPGFENNIETG